MEKTNIGSKLALYPMPVTVIGTMDGDKPEWLQVDHVGIIGHNRILVSMFGKHHTNPAIKASKKLSINLVDRNLLSKADYVGSVNGEKVDKSEVFEYHIGEGGTPIIEESPSQWNVRLWRCLRWKASTISSAQSPTPMWQTQHWMRKVISTILN